jgi:ATP-binding cassette subfamily F protein 3
MNEVTFGYSPEKLILQRVNFDIGFDSRIAIVGANGAGKSTLFVEISRGLSQSKMEVGLKS